MFLMNTPLSSEGVARGECIKVFAVLTLTPPFHITIHKERETTMTKKGQYVINVPEDVQKRILKQLKEGTAKHKIRKETGYTEHVINRVFNDTYFSDKPPVALVDEIHTPETKPERPQNNSTKPRVESKEAHRALSMVAKFSPDMRDAISRVSTVHRVSIQGQTVFVAGAKQTHGEVLALAAKMRDDADKASFKNSVY
jgi:hypothetical protein